MKLNSIACVLLYLCAILHVNAQDPFPENGVVFDDSEVARVDLYLNSSDLNYILDPDNIDSNEEFSASFHFRRNGVTDTLQNVGFRLRGNTSRSSYKKSFKVSFNTFEAGRKYHKLEKLNLNGEHNDPTILRSKLCWDLYRRAGIVAARASHVELYVNTQYRGLYINVEHIDEQFVKQRFGGEGNLYRCLWPATLEYISSNPNAYKISAYELKTNLDQNDYSDLSHFIDVLNNTPIANLPCELEDVFEVDDYLRVIAMDILTGNWDGPIVNKNNFYLYSNPVSGKMHYIPFDLDNTFGIDWFGIDWANSEIYTWSSYSGEKRPIYDRLMQVPAYKDKVSYYLNQFLLQFFNNAELDSYLDSYQAQLYTYRQLDTYANQDYSWDIDDFWENYSQALGAHVKYGLKQYIETRAESASEQLDNNNIVPRIYNFTAQRQSDIVKFSFVVQDEVPINTVTLAYKTDNGQTQEIAVAASADGTFAYEHDISDLELLEYRFSVTDAGGLTGYFPRCDFGSMLLTYQPVPNIAINEFLCSNSEGETDEAGEYEDWIELYNYGTTTVSLGGLYLTDDREKPTKWKLPSIILPPNRYVIFWADEDADQGATHTNFKLNKDGEFLGLYDIDGNRNAPIDTLTFTEQTKNVSLARQPNGTGDFQESIPTFNENNEGLSSTISTILAAYQVYPNPSSETLHLSPDCLGKYLELYNIQGRRILGGLAPSSIDVSALPQGLYYLSLTSDDGVKQVLPIQILR